MSDKIILVTGGTGAIGSNLVKRLVERNDFEKLIILDNNSSGHADNAVTHDRVVYVHGDICDDAILDTLFEHDITHVYHLAANFANQLSVDFPVKDLTTNGIGIVKLLERSVKHKVQKFIYSSSSCVYKPTGKPFSETSPLMLSTPYAITKLLSEHYVTFYNKFRGLNAVIVRYFSSYGPGDYPGKFRSVIPNFLWSAMHGAPLMITGTGEETRPFTYVDDIVEGTIIAMEKSPHRIVKNHYTHPLEEDDNLVYNIGTETATKMADLATIVNALCGNKSEIVYVPRRDWDVVPHRPVDASKAKRELGFEANTSLEEGLQKTLEWYMSDAFNKSYIQ
jgi:UDP-glucose 4-epimerase